MLDRGHHLTLRSAVARQLVRDHHTRHAGLALQQLPQQAFGGPLVPPLLDENVEQNPSWSTACQSQCFFPLIIRHTWRVARGSLTPTSPAHHPPPYRAYEGCSSARYLKGDLRACLSERRLKQ